MSSNEDQSAEVKETEEVEVGERPAVDGVNEAVGGGGDGSAGSGGDGPVRYTDTEVREMSPGRRLEVVAQGALSVPQMRELFGISSSEKFPNYEVQCRYFNAVTCTTFSSRWLFRYKNKYFDRKPYF